MDSTVATFSWPRPSGEHAIGIICRLWPRHLFLAPAFACGHSARISDARGMFQFLPVDEPHQRVEVISTGREKITSALTNFVDQMINVAWLGMLTVHGSFSIGHGPSPRADSNVP